MRTKTVFIIILTALATIILMKNTDEVIFWIFGDRYVPKLAVLGTMFAFGLIVGFLLGRPRKKSINASSSATTFQSDTHTSDDLTDPYRANLSDDDRKYID